MSYCNCYQLKTVLLTYFGLKVLTYAENVEIPLGIFRQLMQKSAYVNAI